MVNFGGGAAAILGIFLAVAGAGLFFLRSIRPELARDYDIFFAAVGLLCGIILVFNGWRLDPILQFSQFLLTGTSIFFAFESIRMRGAATEQARRNTQTVDRDRPVSRTRVYTEAELDKIDPYDNVYEGAQPNYSSPRLRGYDEPAPRPPRRSERRRTSPDMRAEVRDEPRRRPSRNRPETRDSREYRGRETQGDRYGYEEPRTRPRRRRPPEERYDDWDDAPRPTRAPIEERYAPSAAPEARRPSPADLGRSYEPADETSDNSSANVDFDTNREPSYDDPKQPIPGDFVVDYQPLEDMGTEYEDDDYDDYDQSATQDADDDYDDYDDRAGRQPINFNRD